jgi:phosphate-selective porin OprO/OprP
VLGVASSASAQQVADTKAPLNDEAKKKSEVESLKERVADLEKRLEVSDEEKKKQDEKKQDPPKSSGSSIDLSFKWSDGLKLESADKKWKFHLGGRVMADAHWIAEDEDTEAARGDQEDGFRFRRARLTWGGEIYERFEFKFEVEFSAGTDVEFKDMGLVMKKLWGSGGLRLGHWKEPFGFEELTSSLNIWFNERSLPIGAFAPAHNMGITAYDAFWEDRIAVAFGIFKDTNGVGINTNEGEYAITARIAALILQPQTDEDFLLHLGLGLSRRSPTNDTVSFSVRPENRHADSYVSVSMSDADADTRVGFEVAARFRQFSGQLEFFLADIDSEAGDDPTFTGFSIALSYFVTGEVRPYKKGAGTWDRIKPKQNLFSEGGFGAVEIKVRYSNVDFDDGAFSGDGRALDIISLGGTWYLNPNVRIMLDISRADLDGIGDTNLLAMRVQFDF